VIDEAAPGDLPVMLSH